jgi:ankyrin repeat protein
MEVGRPSEGDANQQDTIGRLTPLRVVATRNRRAVESAMAPGWECRAMDNSSNPSIVGLNNEPLMEAARPDLSNTIAVATAAAAAAAPSNPLTSHDGMRRRMDRLRDRWWELLQAHDRRIILQQQQVELSAPESTNMPEETTRNTTTNASADQNKPESVLKREIGEDPALVPMENHHSLDSRMPLSSSSRGAALPKGNESATYQDVVRLLAKAIQTSNRIQVQQALQALLHVDKHDEEATQNGTATTPWSPLQVAVLLDRSTLIPTLCTDSLYKAANRIILWDATVSDVLFRSVDTHVTLLLPPMLMAVELGLDDCLQAFLSSFGSGALMTVRDSEGNTALHCCCRGQTVGSVAVSCSSTRMFTFLLDYIASSSTSVSNATSLFFKAMSNRNCRDQTPLHVACQYGQADIVDAILNHRLTANLTMLAKLFVLQDVDLQTPLLTAIAAASNDIVMSLLMWRGNNLVYKQVGRAVMPNSIQSSVSCPLTWAVRTGNVDMVLLLLEFDNPATQSVYDLYSALHAATDSLCDGLSDDSETESMLEIIRILVQGGANPCLVRAESTCASIGLFHTSAVSSAAERHHEECLTALVDAYTIYLHRKQSDRRLDPRLQNQPESFFAGIECTERLERDTAHRDALVTALYHSWLADSRNDLTRSEQLTACCLALYKRGITLAPSDLARFKMSTAKKRLQSQTPEYANPPLPAIVYETTFQRVLPADAPKSKDTFSSWSRVMMTLPWFKKGSFVCRWLLDAQKEQSKNEIFDLPQADVILVSNDGNRFPVHSLVMSQSGKLSAAIRFAIATRSQNAGERGEDPPIEITVELASGACRWLLEHLYHGSIVNDLGDDHLCCRDLLDLMVIGEEFLCQTLVQECEMRLLASENAFDRCLCSYCGAIPGRRIARDGTLEYTVQVTGPTYLITEKTSIDVLAVLQHLSEEACSAGNYSLSVQGRSAIPLQTLHDLVLSTVLRDFGSVVQSDSFINQFDDPSEALSSKFHGMLFRTVVGDLVYLASQQQSSVSQVSRTADTLSKAGKASKGTST